MTDQPREYTEDEIRAKFLAAVWSILRYWEQESKAETTRDKLEGAAFSILAALDGSNAGLPKFIVAPDPHPDDQAFLQSEGENWYPDNNDSDVRCDIAGGLHELFRNHTPSPY